MGTIVAVLENTLMISAFVLGMMLVIEWVNVLTRGWVQKRLALSGLPQYLLAALLGATPGCLGAYTVVALWNHGAVSFGALIAAMIATTGDEAFVLFALMPGKGLWLTLGLALLGLLVGMLVDRVGRGRFDSLADPCDRLEVHEHHSERFSLRDVGSLYRRPSFARLLLVGGALLLALLIATGSLSHSHEHGLLGIGPQGHSQAGEHAGEGWDWVRFSFACVSLLALLIVATAPEHFLEEHLYRHVVLRHLPLLLLWTGGALLVLALLQRFISPEDWLALPPAWLALSAALVGVIPQSGPHLFYVSAHAQGLVPLSALVVSSIVQDGHGLLPLLAESRRAFILVKGIKLLVAVAVGIVMLLGGW